MANWNIGEQFLANRVANYWNKLPTEVKMIGEKETYILGFKSRLEKYKAENIHKNNHYLELGSEIDSRLQDSTRDQYLSYLEDHPAVAARANRNLKIA